MDEIVVGVDESVASQWALERALLEAEASGCPVRVLHAWTAPVWLGGLTGLEYAVMPSAEDAEQLAEGVLAEIVARSVVDQHRVTVKTEAVRGDARQVLVERSQDSGLLVVGCRGQGKLKSALTGSVTLFALHHATCPLMVVPDPGAATGPYQRVVVGADGSPASRSAMRWALDAAVRHECPLIVLHGWLLTTIPGRPPMQVVPSLREFETETGDWLDQEIAEVLPDRRGVDVRAELSYSSASWALLDRAGPGDLLVVGSRGRGGFASLLLGSVASQCAQRTRGVLVVVRAGQERLAL